MPKFREIQDIPYNAGFATRLRAFAFDYLIIFVYMVSLALMTMAVVGIAGLIGFSIQWPHNPFLADLLGFITLILPVILYFTFQESSPKQATWGKRKVGIKVIKTNGGRLSWKRAFLRSLVKFFPWQIAHTCIFQMGGFSSAPVELSPLLIIGFMLVYILVIIYIFSALFTKRHQTPYDWISGSNVIVTK